MGFVQDVVSVPKALIGVVHVRPLPGSPRWGGDMRDVIESACEDASALAAAGFDALILENFGDAPFHREFAGRGAVAGLAAVGARVAELVQIPLGINVLRNDALSAVAVAAAVGARFIRVNVHVGAAVCDQGVVQGSAMATMMAVRDMAPELRVLADVHVKHASPLGGRGIGEEAADAVERALASAVIVTGASTGADTPLDDVAAVREAVPGTEVLVGSGVRKETVASALEMAEGVIVGSSLMEGGLSGNRIDATRARELVQAARTGGARGC